ncbi:mucin-like protein [Arapaima gigas]
MVYGSLHFITFDGTNYTFKALGEFIVVRLSSPSGSNVFTLQAEMRQLEVDGWPTRVPTVSRLAAFHQGIGKVEWQHAPSGEGLAVLVDDMEVPVKVGIVHMGKAGFAVRCMSMEKCAAVYTGGLHVTVWQGAARTLGVLVEVPQQFYRRTVGLLGLWNSDPTDDFLLSSGSKLPWPQNSLSGEETLQQFSLSWAIPVPESLLQSTPPDTSFQPITSAELMSANPARVKFLRKECQENLQCIHDILATNSTSLGMQSVANKNRYHNLALIFGNMPPIVTMPTVIQCRVNVTSRVQFIAQDPNNNSVNFSLLFPRPPLASIGNGDGVFTWKPLNIQPVMLTVMVTDQLFSSFLTPVIQICNCLNGGTCQYTSIAENHLQGKFQVVGCLCPKGFGGKFCGNTTDACRGRPCFPGVSCQSQWNNFTCGQCPPSTVHQGKPGYKCFENDFCLPPVPFPCHKMADCISTRYNYTCSCKPGFTGDGHNCTDIDECMDPSACPNAKFECVNTPGSVHCSCRYKSIKESDGCGTLSSFLLLPQLHQILSMGFQNKFYNASATGTGQGGQTSTEYRINVSSDTPHWYVQDYLTRVSQYYAIKSSDVRDLDECMAKEAICHKPALCANTYGGYRCVCNGTLDVDEIQSCILGDQKSLILGLVLGIGIPFLLLLLLAVLACFCCTRKKTITGEIAHCVPEYMQQQYKPPPFNYSDPALHYRTHGSPHFVDEITVRRYHQ